MPRPAALSLAVALILAAGCLAPITGTVAAQAPRKTVAVLYFDNYTGKADLDPLGRGIASMMISDLSAVPQIQLVERDRIQDVVKEMELQRTRYFDSTTAIKVGKLTGAEYIIVGAFATAQPQMRIDTRVVRVVSGQIVKTAQVVGREDEFFDLQQRLANRLIDGLGVALSPEDRERLAAKQQANRVDALSTMVSYGKALSLYDKGEYIDAATTIGPALQASPNAEFMQVMGAEMKQRAASKAADMAKDKLKKSIGGWLKRP